MRLIILVDVKPTSTRFRVFVAIAEVTFLSSHPVNVLIADTNLALCSCLMIITTFQSFVHGLLGPCQSPICGHLLDPSWQPWLAAIFEVLHEVLRTTRARAARTQSASF